MRSGFGSGFGSSSFFSGLGAGRFMHCGSLGFGIVTNGCFLRIINVVVATYSGAAAKIKMPKTKPANPCSCAFKRRCH